MLTWLRQTDQTRKSPRRKRRAAPDTLRPWMLYRGQIGGDALRFYLSGADSDGASQADPHLSLGDYRAAEESTRCHWLYATPVANLTLDMASRYNGVGVSGSIITVSANKVRYRAPGSATAGPAVKLSNGDSATLYDGADPSKWVRVTRASASDLQGQGTVEFVDEFHNLFGLSDVADGDRAAGTAKYRGVFFRAEEVCTSIKAFIQTLGDSAVTSGGVLSGSGSGTITGPTDAFAGWPERGWARIHTSGGSLREIVYYESRTTNVLTITSDGRACLGSSAAAGATDDVAYPVPGIRIGWEAASPLAGGSVQSIADEDSEPTSISWVTGISAATGVSIGALGAGEQGILWIHRESPPNAAAHALHLNQIKITYDSYGVSYSEYLAGAYRIEDLGVERYELHIGEDAAPDISGTPTETFTSLPHTTATELDPSHTYYLVTNFRNRYNLVSQSINYSEITVDSSGDEQTAAPSAPTVFKWEAAAGGVIHLEAAYYWPKDGATPDAAAVADTWLIYATFDGTDPDPGVDTPVEVAMVFADGAVFLDYDTAAQSHGTDCRVLVRARRSSDSVDSTNTTVSQVDADAQGPDTPTGSLQWRGVVSWRANGDGGGGGPGA